MYAPRSTIRYFPDHSEFHYTAVVLENGSVFHVKGGTRQKTVYDSVDDWLLTLPGFVTEEDLHVSTFEQEQARRAKIKLPKKVRWIKPTYDSCSSFLPWARHIWNMMKKFDAPLLTRDDVRDAWNHFLEILLENSEYAGSMPTVWFQQRKYDRGVDNQQIASFINTKSMFYGNFVEREVIPAIREAYDRVFEYLKPIVLPSMIKTMKEIRIARNLKVITRRRDQTMNKIDRLTTNYNQQIAKLHTRIEYYQEYITDLKNERDQ